jgi:hypothetical protein
MGWAAMSREQRQNISNRLAERDWDSLLADMDRRAGRVSMYSSWTKMSDFSIDQLVAWNVSRLVLLHWLNS